MKDNNVSPLVSVIVPVYNVEKYLIKCIDSIVNQTYSNIEIILIDDGSPDNCGNICDEYAKKDKRINVIHQENMGLSAARNAGLDIAKGQYICFVDSDDWLELNLIEDNIKLMQDEDLDIIIFGYFEDFSDSVLLHNQGNKLLTTAQIKDLLLTMKLQPSVWNKIYKKEVYEDIRFPVGQNIEDIYVLGHILKKATKLFCNGGIYYHYNRCNLESITKNINLIKDNYNIFDANKQLFFCARQMTKSQEVLNVTLRNTVKYALKTFNINLIKNELSEKQKEAIVDFFKEIGEEIKYVSLRNRILRWGILNDLRFFNFIDGYSNIYKRYKRKR